MKTPGATSLRRGALLAGLLAIGVGCRPGEGDRCFCQGECRGGLVCSAAGAVLREGQCVDAVSDNIDSGVCVAGDDVAGDDSGIDPPPYWDLKFDLPKTDFWPHGGDDGPTGTTTDATGSTSVGTVGTTSSGSTTSGTQGSGTTSSAGTTNSTGTTSSTDTTSSTG